MVGTDSLCGVRNDYHSNTTSCFARFRNSFYFPKISKLIPRGYAGLRMASENPKGPVNNADDYGAACNLANYK